METERRNRPGLPGAGPGFVQASGGRGSVGAWRQWIVPRDRERRCVARDAPAVTAGAAPAGSRPARPRPGSPGERAAAATGAAGRFVASGTGRRRAISPARRDEAGGVGRETNAMRLRDCDPDAGHQPPKMFPDGVWRLETFFVSRLRARRVGSFVVALPRREPSTAGPLRGHRPAGIVRRVASPVSPGIFRFPAPTSRPAASSFSRAAGQTPG